MNENHHYNNLKKAIQDEKLIVFQYSCTDLKKEQVNITSAFAVDYFTDEEWYVFGDDLEFRKKVNKYLNRHEDYYFLFWNFNINYCFNKFDLGIDELESCNLNDRCIDFDDVLEVYAEKKGYQYVKKGNRGIDTRYYLALLNKISIPNSWISGEHEINIKNYLILKNSSRSKAKLMVKLLNKFINDTLDVHHDDKYIEKSKKIKGYRGKINYYINNSKELFNPFLTFVAGIILGIIIGVLANFITDIIKNYL